MNTTQWRKEPNMVDAARRAFSESALRAMLACVKESDPIHTSPPPLESSPHATIRFLGMQEGYHLAIAQLESLVEPIRELPDEPEPTFDQDPTALKPIKLQVNHE